MMDANAHARVFERAALLLDQRSKKARKGQMLDLALIYSGYSTLCATIAQAYAESAAEAPVKVQ